VQLSKKKDVKYLVLPQKNLRVDSDVWVRAWVRDASESHRRVSQCHSTVAHPRTLMVWKWPQRCCRRPDTALSSSIVDGSAGNIERRRVE
jgi:hypothetical protein